MRVLTLGTFDLLHAGHVRFLNQCSMLGAVTVGVNTDGFAATYKRTPVIPEDQRLEIISALRAVHDATLNDGPGIDLITARRPNILAIGPDWFSKDYPAQIGMTADDIFRMNISLVYVSPARVEGLSASEIRERLR